MQGAGRLSALRVDPATGRKWRVGAEDTVGQEELARDIDMPTGASGRSCRSSWKRNTRP